MAVETEQKQRSGSEGADGVSDAQPRELSEEESRRLEEEEQRGDASVEAYARDHEGLTEENEQDALDFLLAPKKPRLYDVKVDFDTDEGIRPLTFVLRAMDGRKIDEMEQRHRSETTGQIDVISYDCELVATATAWLEARKGRKIELDSEEFLTLLVPDPDNPGQKIAQKVAAPPIALERRFQTQLGLLTGVARQVRAISGYDPQRVGSAHRRLVTAVGNS